MHFFSEDIHVYAGSQALCQVVEFAEIHVVLTALVGYAGLKPTLAAIEAGKDIALANKETKEEAVDKENLPEPMTLVA